MCDLNSEKWLTLDIVFENLSQKEIFNLKLGCIVIQECIEKIKIENEEALRNDRVTWKNQWKDHIPE